MLLDYMSGYGERNEKIFDTRFENKFTDIKGGLYEIKRNSSLKFLRFINLILIDFILRFWFIEILPDIRLIRII